MESQIIKYKNIACNQPEVLKNIDWSRNGNHKFSKVHSISSYIAMFTPSLPAYFIKKYSNENDLVMDNFSGRGTTALVCRELKRRFVGSDLNPYAYVITKFKLSKVSEKNFLKFLYELKDKFDKNSKYYLDVSSREQYQELSYFYNKLTLAQLIFLRDEIGKNWLKNNVIKTTILAIALGLMHGQVKKDNTSIYFSVDMPNTISFTPNYVKKFVEQHHLQAPEINIFEKIKNRFYQKACNELNEKYDGNIYFWDATKENKKIKNNSVDLVITSPPYVSIVDYTASNWLRLWLLGFERNNLKYEINLSDKIKRTDYSEFISNYLNAIYKKLKDNAKVCLVVGDVHREQLIENVWKSITLKFKGMYKFKEIYYDQKYNLNQKVTTMLGSSRSKGVLVEKVLVLEKVNVRNQVNNKKSK